MSAGGRIAIADTDRTVLELLQIRLELAGYRAYVSRDSAELLETVRIARPTAMVLDLNLNGGGAKAVLEQLKRKNQLTFPVLVMGRNMTPEILQEALQLGARACIIKPFSGADVLERVNWMMRPPPPAERRPMQYVDLDA